MSRFDKKKKSQRECTHESEDEDDEDYDDPPDTETFGRQYSVVQVLNLVDAICGLKAVGQMAFIGWSFPTIMVAAMRISVPAMMFLATDEEARQAKLVFHLKYVLSLEKQTTYNQWVFVQKEFLAKGTFIVRVVIYRFL